MLLLDTLPPVPDMKKHLEKRKHGRAPRLQDIDPTVSPSAWSVLRWIVASCTAHLEEISEEGDLLGNVGASCILLWSPGDHGICVTELAMQRPTTLQTRLGATNGAPHREHAHQQHGSQQGRLWPQHNCTERASEMATEQ